MKLIDCLACLSYSLAMLRAAFPGSFDPCTYGHLNIIERARTIFEEIVVIVAENQDKRYLFSVDERLDMIRELVQPWPNVAVERCDTLVVDYAVRQGIRVLLRGVRGVTDFSYEFDLSMINRGLNPSIETIFMTTEPKYFVLRSSSIKELASFGGDVSQMVPPRVAQALRQKFGPSK